MLPKGDNLSKTSNKQPSTLLDQLHSKKKKKKKVINDVI